MPANTDSPNPQIAAVEMRGITKQFGTLRANHDVDLTLKVGQIHALLGENGAGKSTLSKVLYGLYQPDTGTISVYGKPVRLTSPADAINAGIGMVTQHFSLVPSFTVTENIVLGLENGLTLDREAAAKRIKAISQQYSLKIDPHATVRHLAVGEQQRVEILKQLYRNCRVLILDEPTAVLTPQESDALFVELKLLVAQGLSILFISHKLDEITNHCHEVTVLRLGQVVYSGPVGDLSTADLARQMVGRDVVSSTTTAQEAGGVVLDVRGVSVRDQRGVSLLRDIDLSIRAGEIVGMAGVAGNGQRELGEVLSGLRKVTAGTVSVRGQDLTNANPEKIAGSSVGRIPEDRLLGIVGTMSVAYNLALEHLHDFTRNGVVDQPHINSHAADLIKEYQIKAQPNDQARRLSGGNIQKIILARTLSRKPAFILAAQPTRGLDIGATEYVHDKLRQARHDGAAVLLISEDLDEIMKLADRIVVMYAGQIMGSVPAAEATRERIGLLMGGQKQTSEVTHG
ncbi:MAG: ABC transporter ATP-binding protein [Anaerolineae bacterium]|nr:ABC transporter ATP-binding protein [Anaerolineae bacterium]